MRKNIYINTHKPLLIRQLDLFTEFCLQCESSFLSLGNERDASIMRDCADLNTLLYQFMKRRSHLDKALIKCCFESWSLCSITILEYEQGDTFEKCNELCKTCITDFKEYIINC